MDLVDDAEHAVIPFGGDCCAKKFEAVHSFHLLAVYGQWQDSLPTPLQINHRLFLFWRHLAFILSISIYLCLGYKDGTSSPEAGPEIVPKSHDLVMWSGPVSESGVITFVVRLLLIDLRIYFCLHCAGL